MPGLNGYGGAQQYATFTKEAAWGTFDSSATAKFVPELENNALVVTRKPVVKKAESATSNIHRRQVASKYGTTGTFKTKAHPDVMKYLIPWAFTQTISSGKKILPSFTVDHFDGVTPRRFRGCRIDELAIESTADLDWVYCTVKFTGRDEDSTPPTMTEPLITDYPQIDPWSHIHSAGFIKLKAAGTVQVGYRAIHATLKNKLDPQFDELPILNSLDYNGRSINWDLDLKIQDASVRGLWENQTTSTGQVKWSYTTPGGSPVTYSMTLDLQAANYPDGYDPERDFNKTQYNKIMLDAFIDPATGLDCVATVAP